MDIARLQKDICKVITGIGGHIKYKKELRLPARIYYYISRKEPIINIEAFFLGERFGVIIEEQKLARKINMFNAGGYRIIICNSLPDFQEQFDRLKEEKLNQDK
jgi:hypothetical protein